MKKGFVYIETNIHRTVLYCGVTSNIENRHKKHIEGFYNGFSKKYNTRYLVYVEEFNTIRDAIDFERTLKKWRRDWKINLIQEKNPHWLDLSTGKPIDTHLSEK